MRMYDILTKKKQGHKLSSKEIEFFINGYVQGSIPDYQASALLMAIAINGLDEDETAALTLAVANSGHKADLSKIKGLKADKHSTGGVGDKTTLVAIPIAAACGIKVPKMSGRGLGHTGGTVDKLEAIQGYRTEVDTQEFIDIVNEVGCGIIGQSGDLAPADKKLYALRDVTATVDSLPLIVASIMGKKLAVGADCIVLDVKTGSGAFCKTLEDTKELANAMVQTGKLAGKRITALITDMDTPLGNAVGNYLEVAEALATLQGKGPTDLTQISVAIATEMLYLSDFGSYEKCKIATQNALSSGIAYTKFVQMVRAFGGDTDMLCNGCNKAKYSLDVVASKSGFVAHTNTEKIGVASLLLGAGRAKKEDSINYLAGITLCKKRGDAVCEGDTLAVLYADDAALFASAQKEIADAYTISDTPPHAIPLIYDRISTKSLI